MKTFYSKFSSCAAYCIQTHFPIDSASLSLLLPFTLLFVSSVNRGSAETRLSLALDGVCSRFFYFSLCLFPLPVRFGGLDERAASHSHCHIGFLCRRRRRPGWLTVIDPTCPCGSLTPCPSPSMPPLPVVFRWVMETRELSVVAGSFVGFQFLFSVASPRLSLAITTGYKQLPPTKLTEWNSRCVGTKTSHREHIYFLPPIHVCPLRCNNE